MLVRDGRSASSCHVVNNCGAEKQFGSTSRSDLVAPFLANIDNCQPIFGVEDNSSKRILSRKIKRWATYTELAGLYSQSCCTTSLSNLCLPPIDCFDNLAKRSSMNLVCICYKVDPVAAPSQLDISTSPEQSTVQLLLGHASSIQYQGMQSKPAW
jgi:hypothetical protein